MKSTSLLLFGKGDNNEDISRKKYRANRRKNHNRYLRDFSQNHTKQHYTYQYMSYYESNNNNNNNDSSSNYDINSEDHIITTSVSIRVTPIENYYISWSILWSCFIITAIIAVLQVLREHHIFNLRRRSTNTNSNSSNNNNNLNTKNGVGATSSNSIYSNTVDTSSTRSARANHKMTSQQQQQRPASSTTAPSIGIDDESHVNYDNNGAVTASSLSDGESVSTADLTRSMFRKLLLFAMITRIILMPVQIWSDPMWWQFVSDTLPEIVFATAWTVLVTFFVQLVGIATGTGNNTSPGLVISATVYFVYFILIVLQLFNRIASVLLYALMCCIYATLFGVVIYFCPKLISLMRPSLESHRGLAVRLIIATTVCIVIFGIHCINYARLVIAPPRRVYWWYQYGVLELLPSIAFLIIMHPQLNKGDRSYSPIPEISSRLTVSRSGIHIYRVDSGIRNTTTTPELDNLLPSHPGIGGSHNNNNNNNGQVRTPVILQNKGPASIGYGTNLQQVPVQQQRHPSHDGKV